MLEEMSLPLVKTMFPVINGLFSNMDYSFPEILAITKSDLDLRFVTEYGLRTVSPLVSYIHQSSSATLSVGELISVSRLILQAYAYKWDKEAAILTLEYDPIHNYSDIYQETMTEGVEGSHSFTRDMSVTDNTTTTIDTTITDGGSETRSTTRSLLSSVTDGGIESTTVTSSSTSNTSDGGSQVTATTLSDTTTRTDNLSEATTGTNSSDVFGFNSSTAVGESTGASNTSRTNTGTQGTQVQKSASETITGGLTKSASDSSSEQTVKEGGLTKSTSDTGSEQLTIAGGLTHTTDDSHVVQGTKRTAGTEGDTTASEKTRNREFSHLGNIGNQTTQQLIREEIELWRWNYINMVLSDVKDFLTLPIYS